MPSLRTLVLPAATPMRWGKRKEQPQPGIADGGDSAAAREVGEGRAEGSGQRRGGRRGAGAGRGVIFGAEGRPRGTRSGAES